jgi:hypothetical protein
MKQRTYLEFRGHAFLCIANANENVCFCQKRHFRMADIVRLSTRHDQPKWFKRAMRQQIAKSLNGHILILHHSTIFKNRSLSY